MGGTTTFGSDMSELTSGSSIARPWLARARAAANAAGHKRQRSVITNGRKLLAGVDGRNPWLRRAKDLIREHVSDLGGPDNVSVAEVSIIRRAATITAELERLEAKFALAGEADSEDLDLYLRGANNLRRLLESVGLRRRPRDITDPLTYAREVSIDEGAL
jgi:hypothetical protein